MLPEKTRLLNILFLGSDHFSIGTLEALLKATSLWSSIHVVTAGEKDVGRGGKKGMKRMAPPLHDYAHERGLKVFSVPSMGIKEWQPPEQYTSLSPSNFLITSSFGHILPTSLLQHHFPLPQTRLNVHPSILPQYRGAAPIQWAIANREAMTGVSVQSLAMGGGKMVDKGELWGVVQDVPIHKQDTYGTILPRLATLGGDLLVKVLYDIQAGTATSIPQVPASTAPSNNAPIKLLRAPKITHELVKVDFAGQAAEEVEAMFRGMSHQHALWTTLPDGQQLRLLDIRIPCGSGNLPHSVQPGTTIFQKSVKENDADSSSLQTKPSSAGGRLLIRTRDMTRGDDCGWIDVRRVQQAGKKEMSVADWWNGLKMDGVDKGRIVLGA